MEVGMIWQLPGGAMVSLQFASNAVLPTPEQFDAIRAYLEVWSGQAGQTEQQLAALQEGVHQMSANLDTIKASIAALQADVAAQSSVTQSAVTLISGLQQQLADALASDLALPELTAQLEGINAGLDAARDQLAAAIIVNTPAEVPVVAEVVLAEDPPLAG